MRLPRPPALMSRSCNDGSEGFRGRALAARLAVPIHPLVNKTSAPGARIGLAMGLRSEFTRKGDPCLQAGSTAELGSLVGRVHEFESCRSALRTGICHRQIDVGAFVSGADATIDVLPPISFASQQGTLHRATNARCEAHARQSQPTSRTWGAKACVVFWQKRQTHLHNQAGHVRRVMGDTDLPAWLNRDSSESRMVPTIGCRRQLEPARRNQRHCRPSCRVLALNARRQPVAVLERGDGSVGGVFE
jgi:hypothetical protein